MLKEKGNAWHYIVLECGSALAAGAAPLSLSHVTKGYLHPMGYLHQGIPAHTQCQSTVPTAREIERERERVGCHPSNKNKRESYRVRTAHSRL